MSLHKNEAATITENGNIYSESMKSSTESISLLLACW